MSTLTQALTIVKPTPGDPATQNTWGYTLDADLDMIDTAVAGVQTVNVTGTSLVLSSTPGSPDQTRAAIYVLQGVITSNCTIYWPEYSRKFVVQNNTTGAYQITLAVGDGGAPPSPVGATATILQGVVGSFMSDGTNIYVATSSTGQRVGTLIKSVAGNTNVILTQQEAANGNFSLTGALTGNILLLFPKSYQGVNTIYNGTTGNFTLTLGIDNGSGSAAGSTKILVPGGANVYAFDGTNAAPVVNPQGIGLLLNNVGIAVASPSVNIILTYAQATFANVRFTGTLTTGINTLWPANFVGIVAVGNLSTSPYNITIGVDNGSGSPAGATAILNHNGNSLFAFDGTNCYALVDVAGLFAASYIVRAIAVARCPGGVLTSDFLGGCTLARTGAGVYTLAVTSGVNFVANGASIVGNAFDTVTGKPLLVSSTANAGGVNPSFTINTDTGAGVATDFTSGVFLVFGGVN